MIATLRREYRFEAAHRLPFVPEGHKCGRTHGHSYRITVLVRGSIRSDGMVVDFAEIDRVARPIIEELDHSSLNDRLQNPTSELLALWMLRRLRSLPNLFAVQVAETERSSCMVTMDDAACVMRGAEGGINE